jgi:hypothetical protein
MSREKDNTTKQQPEQIDDHEEEVVLRRRRLLKGAAAAPMVLTLFSGAAAARTSTVVIEATKLEETVDLTKGVEHPICVDDVSPIVGPPENAYHVEGASQPFSMDEVFVASQNDPPIPNVPAVDAEQAARNLFDWYTEQCEQQGGIVIVASSATSLTH